MDVEIVDDLRQDEYTGEDRCWPCTVLNVGIAGLLGSIAARKSRVAGWFLFVVSVGLIYLRGYLVPGTPTLTKRYLPPEILELFGKDTEPPVKGGLGDTSGTSGSSGASSHDHSHSNAAQDDAAAVTHDGGESQVIEIEDDAEADAEDDVDAEDGQTMVIEILEELNAVEPCEDRDDLCLTDDFEEAWEAEIDDLDPEDVTAEQVADGFDLDDEDYEIEEHDDARILKKDEEVVGQWPSQAALVADVSGAALLSAKYPAWESFSEEEKGVVLRSLRLFLTKCPTTGGDIEMSEETVESCCQSHDVIAVTCEDTDERLFEHAIDG